MKLPKIISRNPVLYVLIAVLLARAIWQFHIDHDVHSFLIVCTAVPAFLILFIAFISWIFKKLDSNQNFMMIIIIFSSVVWADFCRRHFSKTLAVLPTLIGALFTIVLIGSLIYPDSEERRYAKRTRVENLLANRSAFEKNWQRRIKVAKSILFLFCALLSFVSWMSSFKILAIVPAFLGMLFLIRLFANLTPMSEEKFEKQLAKAKARQERIEARRAKLSMRRDERSEHLEEQKKQQKPSSPAMKSFYSFVYSSLMLCFFWFQDRSRYGKPDLIFCAVPACYLIRAVYFFIRQKDHPKGTEDPIVSESAISS
jgi:Flp pilus assembly protein TadB